jgi:prepilin-type N-terminal cleavage/methylation domain-containing protein
MTLRLAQINQQTKAAGFTLVETLIALFVFGLVMSGVLYGYVQINRMAEWSSMSLAVQSAAASGAERARAADWRPRDYPVTNGPGTMDELPPAAGGGPVFTYVDFMDIPIKGDPASTNFSFWITNCVYVSNISTNPPLRQIQSVCFWTFPLTGQGYTNTVILLRAPDQ